MKVFYAYMNGNGFTASRLSVRWSCFMNTYATTGTTITTTR
ncbi:MAG TPA: hypothetical protein PKD90_02810 [Phnomibacter sp.]|nr:hypothetical protein [Phnomibacter sp.]